MSKIPEAGDPAPDFDLPADSGGRARLRDYHGKTLVLYFYPKDDTSGCTRQAQEFSQNIKAFRAAGAEILGVSRDNPARHDKFKAKHDLAVTLASDEDGEVCNLYAVWKEKTLYGRKYMGVERSTFLIDAKGRIAHLWRNVRVPGHVPQVLDAVVELS